MKTANPTGFIIKNDEYNKWDEIKLSLTSLREFAEQTPAFFNVLAYLEKYFGANGQLSVEFTDFEVIQEATEQDETLKFRVRFNTIDPRGWDFCSYNRLVSFTIQGEF